MAQAANALTIAPRLSKPALFEGTETAWRVLCDLYPSAETQEIVLAVVEYCAVRRLDPFKKPCHIVPMYNSKLKRRVQVVMQGINEVEITAARTKQWVGMDMPTWGPITKRTFVGVYENDDGSNTNREVVLSFPLWCALTVWRLVAGEKRAFTEQLFWEECYGRASFRSEVPNARWQLAPRQMLHKCTKAAVLRAAFPEEGFGYTAEEAEDREVDTGGVTIDGHVDHGDPGITDKDRTAGAYTKAQPAAVLDLLDEPNATIWLGNLKRLLSEARDLQAVIDIAGDQRVRDNLARSPSLIKTQIDDLLKEHHERLAPGHVTEGQTWDDDPIRDLLADVASMTLDDIASLPRNAAWRKRTADLFPPDGERLGEAIAARRAALKGNDK